MVDAEPYERGKFRGAQVQVAYFPWHAAAFLLFSCYRYPRKRRGAHPRFPNPQVALLL